MRLFALSSIVAFLATSANADPGAGGLYPPGLLPLINKGNILLSTGQFSEAAKIYSEAIDQSPADYLLYYKRATAYFSMQRHSSALEDFDKVLSLTSNTFDNAHLMRARILTREGHYTPARTSLDLYIKAKGKKMDKDAEELDKDMRDGEQLRDKTENERNAQLWNACVESATSALRIASHSIEIRNWRAECALAAGDTEGAVADLTRLSHLLPPSTTLLTHIFRLSYFLLPPSPAPLNTLKQCLHYDPDSKPCLSLHRMLKAFDRSFNKMDEHAASGDWRGLVKLLLSPGGKTGDLWKKWEEAMAENVGKEEDLFPLIPQSVSDSSATKQKQKSKSKPSPLPLPNAPHLSPPRQILVRSLCKAYTHLADGSKGDEYKRQSAHWCELLLTLDGCAEDVDGLVGRGEALLAQEEWEDAVRALEKAFEAGGRSDRAVLQKLQKAQRLLKQSKQKDYYKIVGVSRDADARTIKKAYRQAAKLAHPDKGGSEAKMAALNEAYEVLSNPELRQRFDSGEDPMDPMAQQGGHPFAHGQHPFAQFFQQGGGGFPGGGFPGGGGGSFQFHFGH